MSTQPKRSLPQHPDLRHLKNQAKDLLRSGGASSLSEAQFKLACEYGFSSWPKLKAYVDSLASVGQLKDAINRNDLDRVKSLMTSTPELHRAPLGYVDNGPLTWVAECRGSSCSPERLAIAKWMIENGSDVHQGGDGPLMRASLNDARIPMMELLVLHGADVNARWGGGYPIICAPCESLQSRALRWLIEHGADMNAASNHYGSGVQILITTYARDAAAKHACLDVFANAGYEFPDTAPMAIHRGSLDLLEACFIREPAILHRSFAESEIYPSAFGIQTSRGLHCAPLDGTTLLHMAVEYQEEQLAEWLIHRGADINARAAIDSQGFGGHTPLFHATVTLGSKDASMALLLLRHGANPNLRATIRKRLVDDGEGDVMREFHNVTAIEFAEQFQQPSWVNDAAITAINNYGGG